MQSLTVARSSLNEAMDDFPPDCVKAARNYLCIANGLAGPLFWPVKSYCAVNLFLWHLDAFAKPENPVASFCAAFDGAGKLLTAAGKTNLAGSQAPTPDMARVMQESFEDQVSGTFSDIWVNLTDDIYFDQSHDFTVERLTKNGIDPATLFRGKTVFDAGCGSGKFSAALARLGAARVIGMDIGQKGLDFAKEQARKVPYGDRLDYRYGSLIEIPLPDQTVDFVWSNGVIHHTADYEKCIAEFARILKPAGTMFLYVNGRFGLFELLVDTIRLSMQHVPRALYLHYLSLIGFNSGRIYWITDHSYAPYEWRSRENVEAMMARHGFENIRQLKRGVTSDQIEQVSTGLPFADVKYGEAQLKWLADRK